MPENRRSATRRTAIGTLSVLGVSALAIAGAPAEAQTGKPAMTQEQKVVDHRHDWDWLVGRWNVRHHRLKARLAGSTEWEDFTVSRWPLAVGRWPLAVGRWPLAVGR